MVIIVQGLHPAISSFDWESTRETLCCEQLVPICAESKTEILWTFPSSSSKAKKWKGKLTGFAVGQSLLKEEGAVTKELSTVGTFEAFRVEVLSNRVQAILKRKSIAVSSRAKPKQPANTYAFDLYVAFVARRRDEAFETVFAVELSFLFHESDILKGSTALSVDANEVVRAPDLSQGGDKRSPRR